MKHLTHYITEFVKTGRLKTDIVFPFNKSLSELDYMDCPLDNKHMVTDWITDDLLEGNDCWWGNSSDISHAVTTLWFIWVDFIFKISWEPHDNYLLIEPVCSKEQFFDYLRQKLGIEDLEDLNWSDITYKMLQSITDTSEFTDPDSYFLPIQHSIADLFEEPDTDQPRSIGYIPEKTDKYLKVRFFLVENE